MIMDLPAAYIALDLPPGSSLAVVQARYRKLVKAHHPDRFQSASEKASAEARLKKFNAAKEVISKHWFEAKIDASAPIPFTQANARPQAASQKAKQDPEPEKQKWQSKFSKNQFAAAQKKPPKDPPVQPKPTTFWQAIFLSFWLEAVESAKKTDAKRSFEDALENLDKPFKFTAESRARRGWLAIAAILIIDMLWTGYCENVANYRTISNLPIVQKMQ